MNKVLVVGANGFIGRAVADELEAKFEVIRTGRKADRNTLELDGTDIKNVQKVIKEVKPSAIINCAGVVINDESAAVNVDITMNILKSIKHTNKKIRLIVSGSSAEYGIPNAVPLTENEPVKPSSIYGKYKAEESKKALEFGKMFGIDVVVLRIFNPIGPGMADKFLISSLIKQFKDLKAGKVEKITVTRLDSIRDYVDVRDVASAFSAILSTEKHEHSYYNVGSRTQTTTQQIIEGLAKHLDIEKPLCIESSDQPDPVVSQAGINRIRTEFGWKPTYTLEETLKEIAEHE